MYGRGLLGQYPGMIELARDAVSNSVELLVFPELSITGYTCSDLFLQAKLQHAAIEALRSFARETAELPLTALVGLPLAWQNCRYKLRSRGQSGTHPGPGAQDPHPHLRRVLRVAVTSLRLQLRPLSYLPDWWLTRPCPWGRVCSLPIATTPS